jgi:hypothetical protein
MQELFLEFLKNPTADTFRAIRAEVVKHEKYDGYSRDLDEMRQAFNQKRFADIRTVFGNAQPNLLLSPEAHFLLSLAARELGDTKGAQIEQYVSFRCIDGILATGDGTEEKAYVVLRTSDEYDLLNILKKQVQSQHLVHSDNGRSYDKMVCSDKSEVWFDITDLFDAMTLRLHPLGKPQTS